MSLPTIDATGRLRVGAQTFDPAAIVIQRSWSRRERRLFGVLRRVTLLAHAELRASSGRVVTLSARVDAAPESVPELDRSDGVEVSAETLEALLAGLLERGARMARAVHDLPSALDSATAALEAASPGPDEPEPEPEPDAGFEPRLTASVGEPVEWVWRLGAPLLCGVYVALLAALQARTDGWILIAFPLLVLLLDMLRRVFGSPNALPGEPRYRWMPRVHTSEAAPARVGSAASWSFLNNVLAYISGLLSFATVFFPPTGAPDLELAADAPGGVFVAVTVASFFTAKLLLHDLRDEWPGLRHAWRMLMHGQSATTFAPVPPFDGSVVWREESRGSGKSRHTVYHLRETRSRTPERLALWQPDRRWTVSLSRRPVWSSTFVERSASAFRWVLPEGANVRVVCEAGGVVELFASAHAPRGALAWRMGAALVTTLGPLVWMAFGFWVLLSD